MPAYVVLDIDVHDPITYERYKALSGGAVAAHGGRFLVRGGTVETLEGGWLPSRFVLLEFPSAEAARSWWDSADYAEAKALRQASARSRTILVQGLG